MTIDDSHPQQRGALFTRRDFVRTSAAAVSAAAIAGPHAASAFAAPRRRDGAIHVGLVGCGGRGTGAAAQALSADEEVVIHSVADVFADRIDTALAQLAGHDAAHRVQVPKERRHAGFDGFRALLADDVDVVILATPPHFRPAHLAAAVEAGKHVFCEKPMAVDAPGVRSVAQSCALAQSKSLALVAGFCWRYSLPARATYERIHAGAIGDVVSMHATYHTGPLGTQPRRPEWSDMEWQLRNWWHFTWLSGDHLVEQACHSVDKINWAMRNAAPLRATGLGGRGVRNGPESGNVYDHFTVIYEYASDVRCFLTCRQQPNCANDNSDYVTGSRGTCFVNGWAPTHVIRGESPWHYEGPDRNMYQVEHDELFASIRAGRPINDGEWMTRSTMLSILGRMAAYTGQTITWEQALASEERLGPETYEFGDLPMPPIARPGATPFV
jgi:predicted dehydrogenase